uniref:FACT complex subunit SSRP1 n=1 Tax=Solanum tuberosum TaxID=4113 RepID=M0ZLY1_SOLTU
MIVRDKIMPMAGEEAVVTFGGIAILTSRGLYNVELHLSFLRLHGQANDFKIQYSSLNNQPHTLVVIILRLGKAKLCIPALYLQFEDNVIDLLLALSEGLLTMKYKESLLTSYKGFIHDIFTQILRGLSGSEVTKPGMFRSSQYAVESSLQAENGLMYPWKGSENNEAWATEGVPVFPDDDDDAVDPHLERIKNEAGGDDSDEEDEDFVLNKDDGGSPTDDSGGDESDASGSGAANHVWWLQKSAKKKPKKEATVSKPSTSRKKADGDASKKKKQKKKRDPNPPKKAISAFMYFLQSKREEEKKPFEAMAKADKKRYSEQISDYRNLQPTAMDSGSESGCF